MSDEERSIELLENRFPTLSGFAFMAARKQALAAGLSVLHSEQGIIYEVFPDGRRRRVKQVEPPTAVERGLR